MSEFAAAFLGPSTTLIRFRSQTFTADFLRQTTDEMLARLQALGAGPGDIISYQAPNNPYLFPLMVAASERSLALLCLDDRLSAAEATAIERQLPPRIRFVFHDEGPGGYILEATGLSPVSEELPAQIQSSGGGLFNLTSGTTGPASLIFHDFRQTLESLRFPAREQGITAASRTLSYLSYTHSGGLLLQTLPTLIQGGTLEIERLQNLKNFVSRLGDCSHLILVPSVYQALKKMRQLGALDEGRRKTVVTGSSLVPPELFADLSPRHEVFNVYGLTEVTPFLFFARTCLPDAAAGSLAGQIIPTHEYRLSGEGGIEVRGPLTGFVLDRAAGNLRPLEQPFYDTGDLGFTTADGLVLTGRKKLIINNRGFKFSPAEVENTALLHEDVLKCAVKKLTDASGNEWPVLYLQLRDPSLAPKSVCDALESFLRKRLSPDKIPREFHVVAALPETLIGKNDYGKIS